jgi:hydroxymethylpyrimidine/phosphomethylpyrimidine kinase
MRRERGHAPAAPAAQCRADRAINEATLALLAELGNGCYICHVRPVVLTVAGSDSSGGAGVVADVRTFAALGVWPAVALTAVTAQSARHVSAVGVLDPGLVRAQIETAGQARAAKTGMLATAPIVEAVAAALPGCPLVVDPVIVSSSGTRLLDAAGVEALMSRLLPRATVVTPNLHEAAALTGATVASRDDMERAARALVALGCGAALVTGGHLAGAAADCLVIGGAAAVWLVADRIPGEAHGTGCVLSAAIAARLALGDGLEEACRYAKAFVGDAIRGATPDGADPGATTRAW